ncbi:hypothetical protein CDN99_20245 [Roseateles aquatilis]|uniref:YecA family protein n=1 Tax=Roseateles aquatilis TaxID=431061 RepID=A0A246J129_9BURK|nr:YecA family protein [Roseateles aquatilis]OWQ86172.1 hypothetical protein CDN99_20245 [Roseateles aquatilis]
MTAPKKPPSKSAPRPPAKPGTGRGAGPAHGHRAPTHGPQHRAPGHAAAAAQPAASAPPEAWADEDLDRLQALLDDVPAPLEPLDASMLDGFLVAVILQPKPVPLADWWRWVLDSEEGRAPPARFDAAPLLQLVQRRERELKQAIADRQWFDPWVFELDEDASPSETVLPWVAGFALAADIFPGLMGLDELQLTEPLAQLYMHLDPDDLEDADALLEEIESLEPAADLEEAVESLVRASLLLADVSRPLPAARPQRPGGPRRGPAPSRRPR